MFHCLKTIKKTIIIVLSNSISKNIKNKKQKNGVLHCDGVPAESVENVGGSREIQYQFFWASVNHIFNLQN